MSNATRRTDLVLVADIGGSFVRMAAVDLAGLSPGRVSSAATPTESYDDFTDLLARMSADHAEAASPEAPLVLASAGVCDPEAGTIAAVNVPCLAGRPVAWDLSRRLGRRVGLVNDAQAFALAEATLGVGRGHGVTLGAIFGTGVGGGLVVDGRLVKGRSGIAGEWGHGPVAKTSSGIGRMPCGCGQSGCVDTFGGARGLERLHLAMGHAPSSSLEIVQAWRLGDAAAAGTVDLWTEMVSEPLSLAANLTGVSMIATGGGLGQDHGLMNGLDLAVRERILSPPDGPILMPGTVGQAALIGGAILGGNLPPVA